MRTNLSKRIIALLLTLAMIFTLIPGVFAEEPAARTPFTDVTNPQSWYYDAVAYVYENGLMKGMTETTFGPDVTLERCMLVTVLHRIVKEPAATAKVNFTDIPDDAYFKNPVQWAVENEITMGTGETTFSPHDEVTREQLATFLMRFAKYQGKDVSARAEIKDFPDDQDASDPFRDTTQGEHAQDTGDDEQTVDEGIEQLAELRDGVRPAGEPAIYPVGTSSQCKRDERIYLRKTSNKKVDVKRNQQKANECNKIGPREHGIKWVISLTMSSFAFFHIGSSHPTLLARS